MRRLFVLGAIAVVLAGLIAPSVSGASPHQVDPAGMVPPLNPDFDPWVCTVTGAGPICRGSVEDAWQNEDTGLRCGDRPIYTSGTFSSDAVRWHLPDGRATRTFFQNRATEVWTLSPTGDGPTVNVTGSWLEHYVYPNPGDRGTRIKTITGADWQATSKGYGLVWHDVGLLRLMPGSEDQIDFTHGPTDSNHGDLDLVLPTVCEILAG